MLDFNNIIYFINNILFNLSIGFFSITILQWNNYKLNRVFFHFNKIYLYLFFGICFYGGFFALSFLQIYIFSIFTLIITFLWNKKLDKKLVFTKKIKAFFIFLFLNSLIFSYDFLLSPIILILTLICLKIYEILANKFYLNKAKNKIENMQNLTIILITASFGKTSIKNFLYEILKDDFLVYKTPRSVNTLMGLVADINNSLKQDTQIYIAEAGARIKGDILDITNLLNPQICIVGEIGNAHLEYFKNIENIKNTKLECLNSKRLKRAFLHSSTSIQNSNIIDIYDENINDINANLKGLSFKINDIEFKANLLGKFNAQNLAACIKCAKYLNLNDEKIQKNISKIKPVEHRLNIISKEPKFIIDDGFNGNLKGMIDSYYICKSYEGRKVLVTPGIVEVNKEENIKLCEAINECFDLVIISSKINLEVFEKYIKIEKIILKEKSDLINTLANHTQNKDLILFSNDAPSYM